jgi:TfoX/Sxy family transcriptional regulator of competence genes
LAYDEGVVERVRGVLADESDLSERKMFGGLSFMLAGNMCCGVVSDDLVVRVGPDRYETALTRPHARPMDFRGKPLTGFVYVAPEGYASGADLQQWIDLAREFVRTLPAK